MPNSTTERSGFHRASGAALGQHRSTQRKIPQGREDEARLTADIIELAGQYGHYGHRKISELLRRAGWRLNDKRVERIRRGEAEGLHYQRRLLRFREALGGTLTAAVYDRLHDLSWKSRRSR